jgi:tetratricopeptide (TPR) repeat protein
MESDFDLLLRGTACAFPGVLSEERLLDSLDRALGARLLEEHGDGYAFRHPLFREALYAQLSRQRRTRLHGAVALALAARGSEDMEALAHHFDRGGQPDRAVHYLELAGDRAAAVYAYGAAMGHYARAAALAESNGRLPLMLKLGAIYQLVGKWTEAEALYRDALMRAASVEDERAIARSRMALGHVLQQRGAYTEALEELRLAEAELDRLGDRVGLAEVNGVLATVYRQQGQYTHSQSCGERQLAIGTELEDQHIVAEALVNVGTAFARQAKYTEAMTAYERYLLLVEALGDRAGIQQAMGWIGNVHRKLGDLSQALAHFRRQLQLARELSLLPQEGVALGNIALVHEEQADYSAALAHLEQALEIFRCIGDRQRESVALGNIGAALCNLDEHRHAFSKILDALRIAEELGDNRSVALNLANLADLYRRQGRYDDALACIGAATSMVEDLKSPHDLAEALIGLARIFLSRQQGDAAGSVLRRVIPLCRALSISSVLSGALHISAELALRDHRLDEAADLSSESLKLAIEAGRKDIELDAHVLCLRIGVARGIMSAPEAAANLSQIASVWPQERDQAALHYQIWQFDPSLHGHVESAATAYRRLWTKSGALEYRRRYEELTGESLSDAEALPAPPSAALRGSIDLAELLRGADTLIATVEGQAETGALVS